MVSEMLTSHGIPGREKNGAGGGTDAERLLRALGISGKLAGFQPPPIWWSASGAIPGTSA